uniref:Uncharacterized protein n=1 Tax=Chromera velia CCMP2878 TaxID=1169474 RepID=A0A0G4FKF5_9ALVE|eukprot:Cvel_399.t1-p1 / transcript=Cvel_399.t1 / gene=Cvel_399 / organism=Chromera_velia_CCMP2878 / gene_product=hypothetical protein / transcript_product=hypothetical protein / location=Cvel_scaffold13:23048-23719(-) / protein_length=224 / sequence_SO=supercontig / SO=protein_coding / is_pseudo=false
MWSLCPVLSPSFLPHIRVLLLKGCGFSSKTMKCLTDSMGRGDLLNLEVLDLEKNRGGDEFLDVIGGVLRKDAVPQLKDLRLRGNTVSRFPTRKMMKFFQALRSAECPFCLHVSVDLDLSCMPEEIVRGVGAGMYPSLCSLTLVLIEGQLVSFLDSLIQAAEEPKFEVLDLFLRSPPSAGFSLLGEAIQGGRMKSLRRVRCSQSAGNYDDPTEAKITFFTALTQV